MSTLRHRLPVVIDDLADSIQPAERGQARILQHAFELDHPEFQSALDASSYLVRDRLDQSPISRRCCQDDTHPCLLRPDLLCAAAARGS